MKEFTNWSDTKQLKELITNPLIEVGEGSYYSGYYGNQNFEDGCVRYLWGDEKTKDLFNPIEDFGWKMDKLIIGNYVCIAGGATILMGGNHILIGLRSTLLQGTSKNPMLRREIRLLKVMHGLE